MTNPQLLFDPAQGTVALYQDGSNFAGTAFGFWTFHAGTWRHIFPTNRPRLYGETGYDSTRGVYLLKGLSPTGGGP